MSSRKQKTPSIPEYLGGVLEDHIESRPTTGFQLGHLAAHIELAKVYGIDDPMTLALAITLLQSSRGVDV